MGDLNSWIACRIRKYTDVLTREVGDGFDTLAADDRMELAQRFDTWIEAAKKSGGSTHASTAVLVRACTCTCTAGPAPAAAERPLAELLGAAQRSLRPPAPLAVGGNQKVNAAVDSAAVAAQGRIPLPAPPSVVGSGKEKGLAANNAARGAGGACGAAVPKKFKGVLQVGKQKWRARVRHKGRDVYLGRHHTAPAAAAAVDAFLVGVGRVQVNGTVQDITQCPRVEDTSWVHFKIQNSSRFATAAGKEAHTKSRPRCSCGARVKGECDTCGNRRRCEHKKYKRDCLTCNPNSRVFCSHIGVRSKKRKRREFCVDCKKAGDGGQQICPHLKRKHTCRQCKTELTSHNTKVTL